MLADGTVRESCEVHVQLPAGMVKVVVEEVIVAHALLTSDSLHEAAVTCARDNNGHIIIRSATRTNLVFISSSSSTRIPANSGSSQASFCKITI